MTAAAIPDSLDPELLYYCAWLTFGELRAACRARRGPLPDKEDAGQLCTGCLGDLLPCLRAFGAEVPR